MAARGNKIKIKRYTLFFLCEAIPVELILNRTRVGGKITVQVNLALKIMYFCVTQWLCLLVI